MLGLSVTFPPVHCSQGSTGPVCSVLEVHPTRERPVGEPPHVHTAHVAALKAGITHGASAKHGHHPTCTCTAPDHDALRISRAYICVCTHAYVHACICARHGRNINVSVHRHRAPGNARGNYARHCVASADCKAPLCTRTRPVQASRASLLLLRCLRSAGRSRALA